MSSGPVDSVVSYDVTVSHGEKPQRIFGSLDGEFSGRAQYNRYTLTEGRLSLHLSTLRTEDSEGYTCGTVLYEET